jgi:glyoxylase-like metal-dependent hydrolase (beta-lactamase superfamily II)
MLRLHERRYGMYAKPLWTVIETPDGLVVPGPHGTSGVSEIYPGISSTIILIINGGEVLMVDTGMRTNPEYPRGVLDHICNILDSRNLRLKYILITHWHFDHTANAMFLKERYGGEILCHPTEQAIIEDPAVATRPEYIKSVGGDAAEIAADFNLEDPSSVLMPAEVIKKYWYFPVKIDRTVEDGEILPVGDLKIQVLHLPGHTPGNTGVYNPSSNSIYIVDVMYWPTPLHPHPVNKVDDQIASIKKCLSFQADYLFPGHELPRCGTYDAQDYLFDLLIKQYQVEHRLLVALNRHGAMTTTDLHAETFCIKDRYDYGHAGIIPDVLWWTYSLNLVQAHLRRFLEQETVSRVKEDGKIVWEVTSKGKLGKEELEVKGQYERLGMFYEEKFKEAGLTQHVPK